MIPIEITSSSAITKMNLRPAGRGSRTDLAGAVPGFIEWVLLARALRGSYLKALAQRAGDPGNGRVPQDSTSHLPLSGSAESGDRYLGQRSEIDGWLLDAEMTEAGKEGMPSGR